MAAGPGYGAFLRDNAAFLLAGGLLTFGSSYGQTFFISLFAGEIMGDFGLTDGQWGVTYTVATSLSALAMVWAGALTDRFRIRHLAIFVMASLSVACLSMALNPSAVFLIGVIFLLRFAGLGMMGHLSAVAMARWFVASRGKALSVASLGFPLGQATLPILFVWLLTFVDWRMLWVLAALLAILPLPVLLRLLRAERTPQSMSAEAPSPGMADLQWTRGQMIRHPLFWLVVPLLLGPPAFGTALFFHQVHLTQIKGWALVDYVSLLPLFTATVVSSTFLSGAIIDRSGSAWLMQVYLLPFALAFLIMWQAETLWGAALVYVVFGIGSGMQATVLSAFWAEFYGTRFIGGIKSLAGAVLVLGTAIGPGITGLMIDAGHPLPDQMPAIALYFVLAAGLATIGVVRARRTLTLSKIDVIGT
ncbi:MAG: MFS transporter [Jannaschia sp.]